MPTCQHTTDASVASARSRRNPDTQTPNRPSDRARFPGPGTGPHDTRFPLPCHPHAKPGLTFDSGGRLAFWDALRGAAILLMVLDHAAFVFGLEWVRDFTRFAMPLFMVTAGYLATRVGHRYVMVVAAALATLPMAWFLGLAFLHILTIFVLVYPLLFLRVQLLVPLASVLLVVAWNWPLSLGYEPGYVLAFLLLGRFLRVSGWQPPSVTVPGVEAVGRWPLTWYVVHLVLLVLVVAGVVVPATFLTGETNLP